MIAVAGDVLIGMVCLLALTSARVWALAAALFLLPLSHHYVGGAALGVVSLLTLFGHLVVMPRIRVARWPLGMFGCWLALALISGFWTASVGEMAWQMAQMFGYVLFFVAVMHEASAHPRAWWILTGAVTGSAVAMATGSSGQVLTGLDFGVDPTVNYATFYAMVGMVAIPLGVWHDLSLRSRGAAVILIAGAATTAIVGESRAAVPVIAVLVAVRLFLSVPRMTVAALVLAGLAFFQTPSMVARAEFELFGSFSSRERAQIYASTARLVSRAPLVGHGVGSTYAIFMSSPAVSTQLRNPHSHSVYAEAAVELGLGGLLVTVGLLAGPAFAAARALHRAKVRRLPQSVLLPTALLLSLTLLIEGLVEALFFNSKVAYLTVASLALAHAGLMLAADALESTIGGERPARKTGRELPYLTTGTTGSPP